MATGMTLLPRLALAALVSGAAAGLLMTLAILLGAMLPGRGGSWDISIGTVLIGALGAGLELGLIVATLPAFLAGTAMCALGRRFEAARRAPAWAAAGAGAGALLWAVFSAAVRVLVGELGLGRPDGVLLAAMLVGAAAALAFRAVARPGRSGAA